MVDTLTVTEIYTVNKLLEIRPSFSLAKTSVMNLHDQDQRQLIHLFLKFTAKTSVLEDRMMQS